MTLFINTSTVSAQQIRKINKNEFVIDSLALKDYATQIETNKRLEKLVLRYSSKVLTLETLVGDLKTQNKMYLTNQNHLEKIISTNEKKNDVENELAKERLRLTRRQRNTAYVITGATIIVATILLTK
ncbi:hypothetical protein BPT24_121 [Tenacibaculum phage pT24]|uniref:Uncharacterized protein n=1 Tax=Tenacibaculum phage pT24 TaxID=1880590 RepID=A0A1B4XWR4_9CAUD|nr:hypothetical protein HYP10_gp121 [Tenacibaculum phage pT24]BAV39246.1 hypothetical protein BPT24_121 [Tenacibaculum phage pT24]